jgi:hypothetical protein
MIPQYSIILPIRCRTTFTTNALSSLIVNGVRKDHQIILVLDKTSLIYELEKYPDKFPSNILKDDEEGINRVDNWIKCHNDILKKYNIDIVVAKGGKELWLDHRRVSFVLEEGRKHIKHDWVLGYADEDLVFQRNWDEILWYYMSDKDPMKFCVVPSKVTPRPDISFMWLENYIKVKRNGQWLVLPIPVSDKKILEYKYRFPYSKFDDYVQKIFLYRQAWTELCGVRDKGDSSPFFISKALVDHINGWSLEGPYSEHHSLDARFDYRLAKIGVTKIIPRDLFVLHTKNFLFISDEVDQIWGDITNSPISGSISRGLL